MDAGLWVGLFALVGQIAALVFGYLSLRLKASAENVSRLETHIEVLEKRVTKLDADHANCQEDRRLGNDKMISTEAELARLRIVLAEKEASEKLRLAHEMAETKSELKKNTEITQSTAEKVQVIADKLIPQGS